MPARLIHAEYVITCAPPSPDGVIRDGALYVEGSDILEVGPFAELRARHPGVEVLGGDGFAALPGFVNAHHHGRGLSLIQQGAFDGQLETWLLNFLMLPTPDLYWDTLAFAASLIRSGVTSTLHSHSSSATAAADYEVEVAQYARAYQESGLRAALALDVRDQNFLAYDDRAYLDTLPHGLRQRARALVEPPPVLPLADYLALVERLHRERLARGWERVRFFLGPSGPQWCSDQVLRACRDLAERLDVGIHIHILETWYEHQYGQRAYARGVVDHLEQLDFLSHRVSAAHSIWLGEQDLDVYARWGVVAVHNPSSNLRLGAGTAPIPALLARGIAVALGMDNNTLDDDEDMLREMRLATLVQRTPGVGRAGVDAYQALAMATLGGAQALLLERQIGSLEPGKKADIVLLDLEPLRWPYLAPDRDVVEAIVQRATAEHVSTVLIDGQVRLKDGHLTGLDLAEIGRQQRAWAEARRESVSPEMRALAAELLPYHERFYRSWEGAARPPARSFLASP